VLPISARDGASPEISYLIRFARRLGTVRLADRRRFWRAMRCAQNATGARRAVATLPGESRRDERMATCYGRVVA
jgi:hypothetical protein